MPPYTTDAPAARAGDASEEDSLAAVLALEAARPDLDRHTAGDLAHGSKEGKRAIVVFIAVCRSCLAASSRPNSSARNSL